MFLKEDNIMYEDDQIIVCRKPSGIATQTARLGQPDMVSIIKNYLKTSYIGVIHRLDQPVEGILVFAKTKESAAKLSSQSMEKLYYAVVFTDAGVVKMNEKDHFNKEFTLVDYLVKNGGNNTSAVAEKNNKDAKRAELKYRILKAAEEDIGLQNMRMLTEILLKTGRHHQIRVQMAHAGMPLLGDVKYGSEASIQKSLESEVKDVALCAYSLSFSHPKTGKNMSFSIVPNGEAFCPFLPFTP